MASIMYTRDTACNLSGRSAVGKCYVTLQYNDTAKESLSDNIPELMELLYCVRGGAVLEQ